MNNLANRFKKRQPAPTLLKSPTRDAYGFVVLPHPSHLSPKHPSSSLHLESSRGEKK